MRDPAVLPLGFAPRFQTPNGVARRTIAQRAGRRHRRRPRPSPPVERCHLDAAPRRGGELWAEAGWLLPKRLLLHTEPAVPLFSWSSVYTAVRTQVFPRAFSGRIAGTLNAGGVYGDRDVIT